MRRNMRGAGTAVAAAAIVLGILRSGTRAEPVASTWDEEAQCGEDVGNGTTIRWSGTSDRLYIENGGCATLSDIYLSRYAAYGFTGPLYPYDAGNNTLVHNITGQWYLNSSLYVTTDSTLVVRGTDVGGDCDRLLLTSTPQKFLNLRAHGGNLYLESTHVESWGLNNNLGRGGVDLDYTDGRSYISAITEVITDPLETCNGTAGTDMGEARLDIINTEVNHLGWYDSESYGIAYKVRGFCIDHSNPEIFEDVAVTGNILGSHIHHLYFGHYSFGHQGGNFSFNEVHDNVGYGFDPHDDSDYLFIHNNHVYNNGWHGIIASKRCNHVSIQNNHVHDNGRNGLMLHRSCDYATVKNNTAYGNGDAGLALFESSFCEISDNTFYHNLYGIRWSMGSSDSVAYNNHIVSTGLGELYAIYMYRGADEPDVLGSDGRPRRNHVYDNDLVVDTDAFKIKEADDNIIEGNIITGTRSIIGFANGTLWRENSTPSIYDYKIEGVACFDADSDIITPYGNESESSFCFMDGEV